MPPKNLGAATSLIVLGFGPLAIAVTPYVSIAPQPIPLIVTVGISSFAFLWMSVLPEAGKYIPKLDDEEKSEQENQLI